MLYYVLICVALFFVKAQAINFQPIPPFSGNFLKNVADFDSIVEPETSNQDQSSNIKAIRSSMDENKSPTCPGCAFHDKNANKKDRNNIKRELLVSNLVEETESAQGSDLEDKEEAENGTDAETAEETNKADNVTKVAKEEFDQIENPPMTEEDEEVCCESPGEAGNPAAFVKSAPNKGRVGSSLKMQFYKFPPEKIDKETNPKNDKLVTIDLYPEKPTEKHRNLPKTYSYIALLSDDKNFVEVPALRFSIVTNRNRRSRKKRRCKLHKRNLQKLFEPVRTKYISKHSPSVSGNRLSDLHKNKLGKRASSLDKSDNQYLRDADFLIQNIKSSLAAGFNSLQKPEQVDGAVWDNSKLHQSDLISPSLEVKSDLNQWKDDKQLFQQQSDLTSAKSEFGVNSWKDDKQQSDLTSARSDFGVDPWKNDKNLVDQGSMKSEINPLESSFDHQNDLFSVDSEINSQEKSPFKQENLVKNEVNLMDINDYLQNGQSSEGSDFSSTEENLFNNEVSSLKTDQFVAEMPYNGKDNLFSNQDFNLSPNIDINSVLKKNEINDWNKDISDDGLHANLKTQNGLSENLIERKYDGNAKKVGVVDSSKFADVKSIGLSKNVIEPMNSGDISNGNLVNLLKSIDALKNSDPQIKALEDHNGGCLHQQGAQQKTTLQQLLSNSEVAASSLSSMHQQSSDLTTASPLQSSSLPQLSSNGLTALSSSPPTVSTTCSEDNLTVKASDTEHSESYGQATISESSTVSILLQTNLSSGANLTTSEAGSSNQLSSSNNPSGNESIEYEDDDYVDNVLDLLEYNVSTTTAEKIGKDEKNISANSSTSSESTSHISMSVTSVPTLADTNSSSQTPVLGSVTYVSTGKSVNQISKQPEVSKNSFVNKLHDLQKNLKLVFEVQNILSGSKKQDKKNKRSKRDTVLYRGKNYLSKRKCKNPKQNEQPIKVNNVKENTLNEKRIKENTLNEKRLKEVQGLGKLLQWKAKMQADSGDKKSKRFLFKSKRKKKKKKKRRKKKKKKKWWRKIFGNADKERHFLGEHVQNFH